MRSRFYNGLGILFLLTFSWAFWTGIGEQTASAASSRAIHVKVRGQNNEAKDIRLYSGYHALVVGCSKYNNGWPQLPGPVQDVAEVSAALEQLGFSVEILHDPDGKRLRRSLNSLAGNRDDLEQGLVVYFAGHGHTLSLADGRKLGYIVPVDAPDPEVDLVGFMDRAVSMQQMQQISTLIPVKHVLMVFDSCFSGALFSLSRAKPSQYLMEQAQKPVRSFITAGDEGEQVPDESVFKTVFIQGLREGLADRSPKDGYITDRELGQYLQEQVVNYSNGGQHPQYGRIRNPKLDKGDFIFVAGNGSMTIIEDKGEVNKAIGGSLKVETEPSGAIVDGGEGFHSISPALFKGVSSGPFTVRVSKNGYKFEEKKVQIKEGRHLTLRFVLSKKQRLGWLTVTATPGDAQVKVVGGANYQAGMELVAGEYDVEVFKEGYEKIIRRVVVSEGEELHLETVLTKVHVQKELKVGSLGGTQTWVEPSTGMEFVRVVGGCYYMGCGSWAGDCDDSEKPMHKVCVNDFWFGKYEVTQAQWQVLMGSNPSEFQDNNDGPVDNVSWHDAVDFISKFDGEGVREFRLPFEAEWEYAARSGGRNEKFAGGLMLEMLGWYNGNSEFRSHAVGQREPNNIGLYDMSGNVSEWCGDWFGSEYYRAGILQNPTGSVSGTEKVIRGGSWYYVEKMSRTTSRSSSLPTDHYNDLGFRVVMIEK
ncbi:MAG: SUMF1/EgtB/PvdO family nonheme iron enzyme [Desulfobulbaceae bacterium]|nr:SUMF1/EgtB/PvdO family nonheme iron enzyme [Desulfobulbaceae bacterium]